jgi:hypothetical protein
MNSQRISFVASCPLCLLLVLLASLARSSSGCNSSSFLSCFNCSACVSQQLWWCDQNDFTSSNDYGDYAYCAPPSFGCQYGYNKYLKYDGNTCGTGDDSRCTYLYTFRTQYDCNVGVGFCAPRLRNAACIGVIYLGVHLFSLIFWFLFLKVRWSQNVGNRRSRFVFIPLKTVSSSQAFAPASPCMLLSAPPDARPCRTKERI